MWLWCRGGEESSAVSGLSAQTIPNPTEAVQMQLYGWCASSFSYLFGHSLSEYIFPTFWVVFRGNSCCGSSSGTPLTLGYSSRHGVLFGLGPHLDWQGENVVSPQPQRAEPAGQAGEARKRNLISPFFMSLPLIFVLSHYQWPFFMFIRIFFLLPTIRSEELIMQG